MVEWALLALLWAAAGTAVGGLLSLMAGGRGIGLPLSVLVGAIGGLAGGLLCLGWGLKFLSWFPGEIVAAVIGALFSMAVLAIIMRGRFTDRRGGSQ